ncbi:MAG: GldG family protein, partial [Treponema sp.]|nr:GldG family protein [Treponema sp.]
RYGIQVIRTKDENRSESLAALGLVLQKGESFRVVPLQMVSMQVMPGVVLNAVQGLEELEENISGALESLVAQTQTIAYVTGHGCLDMNDPQYGAGNFASLLRDGYTLQELNLATKDIPSDVACIMINGPKEEFSQAELYKIDQFMMRGGNVMLFLDPFVEQYPQDPNNPYAQVKYYANKTGLEQILSKNGIEVKPNYVLDSQCFKRPMQGLGNVNFYHAPIVQKENLAKDNPVTYNLGFLVFLQAGEITSSEVASGEVADLEFTKLASASKKSWTVTADENDEVMIDPRFIVPPTEGVGEHTLALLAQGKFTSCFTGPLADSANAENESALEGNNFIAKGTQKGKLFVASTSQITGPNIISENSGEPIALFLENVVDYMNGKEDLCSMRTKGLSLNPLHVTSGPVANFAKYFNEAGLAVLVAFAGLIVFLLRKRRRNSIRKEFSSEVEKNE